MHIYITKKNEGFQELSHSIDNLSLEYNLIYKSSFLIKYSKFSSRAFAGFAEMARRHEFLNEQMC